MPLGIYADFADCVSKNQDKSDPEAYCGFIKHQIEGASYTTSFEAFDRDEKHFVKVFAIDADTLNRNDWGVTRDAMILGMDTLQGRPLVGPPELGHGPDINDPKVIAEYEKTHKVGEVVEYGVDGYAWAVAEVTDPVAWGKIQSGEWKWVSPLIKASEIQEGRNGEVVRKFRFSHIAFVDKPAYGSQAKTKGTCEAENVKECHFAAALRELIGEPREAQAFPWDECIAKMEAQGADCPECVCAAIKNRTVAHGLAAGLWASEAEGALKIAEKMKTDPLYRYAWDRFLSLYSWAYPSSHEASHHLTRKKMKKADCGCGQVKEPNPHIQHLTNLVSTEDELKALKAELDTLRSDYGKAQNLLKEWEAKEKTRVAAEAKAKAEAVADLKIKAGLAKAEDKEKLVESLASYPPTILDSLRGEYESFHVKAAEYTPPRDVAIRYPSGKPLSAGTGGKNALQLLDEALLGPRRD